VTRLPSSRVAVASLCLLASTFAACASYSYEARIPEERFEVARVDRGDGVTDTFVVEARLEATLQVVTQTDREQPWLGLQVKDLDRPEAERRGVTPYRGLLVTGTAAKSPAMQAGVLHGDVVLSVDGEKTAYADQLPSILAKLKSGQPTSVRVLRGQDELDLQLTPQVTRQRETQKQSIPLDTVSSRHPYAGIVLRAIPVQWSDRMLGEGKNGVLIASVETGSPAWLAGFRCGDLVESCDGAPTPAADELASMIHARGQSGGSVTLSVRRGANDRHEAPIALRDYTTTKKIWVPFVYYREQGVPKSCWTTGPLGILASSKSTYVSDSPGRQSETHDVFRALLGLIRYDTSPRGDRLRLLWFIHIDM
jgi:membrane-associated protease RseP (regulator of RpoE activity)